MTRCKKLEKGSLCTNMDTDLPKSFRKISDKVVVLFPRNECGVKGS